MKTVFYKNQHIDELSEDVFQTLSLLLPYWGLTALDTGEIKGTLQRMTFYASGLSHFQQQKLIAILQHTEIKERKHQPDLSINIHMKPNISAPLTLHTKARNYYLKPLRKETTDVQTRMHKRLWLPVKDNRLSFTCHPNEENNISEWMSYIVIQHFMRKSFQPLSKIALPEYEHLVVTVLDQINPAFAASHLALEQRPNHEDWPELPKKQKKTNAKSKINDWKNHIHKKKQENESTFNPFPLKNKTSHDAPIQPFSNQARKRSIINPFRKK